jgi:hypothetical protein
MKLLTENQKRNQTAMYKFTNKTHTHGTDDYYTTLNITCLLEPFSEVIASLLDDVSVILGSVQFLPLPICHGVIFDELATLYC